MGVKLTWLSHSGFKLEVDDTTVLIDPFLSGNVLAPCKPDDLEADYILLTHAHGDHIGDTLSIARRTGAMIIAMYEICAWAQENGVDNVHSQNTGGGYAHPFGHVKFVRADHSSGFPDGRYGGDACGIVLTLKGKRLYHLGDTALFSDMRLIGEVGIDTALVPIGDNYTMGPDDSIQAIKLIRPRAVFPIHYNTFDVLQQDAASWARRVSNETDATPIVVDPGQSFTMD